jgi:hypothetical protein
MAVAGLSGFVGRASEFARPLTKLADQDGQQGAQVLVGGCLEVGDVGQPQCRAVRKWQWLRNRMSVRMLWPVITKGFGS